MNTTYLALLRGVNVGGKTMLSMAELKTSLSAAGFTNVRTYINSGNVIFEASGQSDCLQLGRHISDHIRQTFKLEVAAVVFSAARWRQVVADAPKDWGKNTSWKHNVLVLLPPYELKQIVAEIGELKSGIETMNSGDGVLYQSLSWAAFSRTTGGKLAAKPAYKRMTVRNYNTSVKLAGLLAND